SLFAVGHDFSQTVAEIGIPAIVMGTTVADLQTSSMLQNFNDITDGHFGDVYNAGMDPSDKLKIGGLLPYKGKLYASVYDFYDANMAQITSHFVSGLDLSVNGDVQGPFQVGGALGVKGFAGLIDGYFGLVPQVWQGKLGGPVLNGQCCLNVIGRTSW